MTLALAAPQGQSEPEPEMVLALRDDVIFGRLAPGTRLVEDALLARFGGSRHFVRQALERLGLVVKERTKARRCARSRRRRWPGSTRSASWSSGRPRW